MDITVRRYSPELAGDWATVLAHARNGIFQFERPYIEYHGDRFRELSALAYRDGRPVALMPAAVDTDGIVTSHPGLTFGGVVLERGLESAVGIDAVNAILDALRAWGGRRCRVRMLPALFAEYPSADVDYALWRRGFTLVRRDLSSVLPLTDSLPFAHSKAYGVNRARRAGIEIREAPIPEFHALLSEVLMERHGVSPVHSCAELELLQSRFPARILSRGAWLRDALVAGALVYDYGRVWHTQYLANSASGRRERAMDLLIAAVIGEARAAGAGFLSFGISTEHDGQEVNAGLLEQKESFGARAIVHDFVEGAL